MEIDNKTLFHTDAQYISQDYDQIRQEKDLQRDRLDSNTMRARHKDDGQLIDALGAKKQEN